MTNDRRIFNALHKLHCNQISNEMLESYEANAGIQDSIRSCAFIPVLVRNIIPGVRLGFVPPEFYKVSYLSVRVLLHHYPFFHLYSGSFVILFYLLIASVTRLRIDFAPRSFNPCDIDKVNTRNTKCST